MARQLDVLVDSLTRLADTFQSDYGKAIRERTHDFQAMAKGAWTPRRYAPLFNVRKILLTRTFSSCFSRFVHDIAIVLRRYSQ